jgi:hypothetical protein
MWSGVPSVAGKPFLVIASTRLMTAWFPVSKNNTRRAFSPLQSCLGTPDEKGQVRQSLPQKNVGKGMHE